MIREKVTAATRSLRRYLEPRALRPTDEASYRRRVESFAAAGRHRDASGGLWDTMGPLIVSYLVQQGLQPDHRVLDLGCGSLRIGVDLVDYLDGGNYYGTDMSAKMLEAGYDIELKARNLQHKLPRDHLITDDAFDFTKLAPAAPFDVALAQSVFSHLPLGHVRLCLTHLWPIMAPGSVFHATFFIAESLSSWSDPQRHEPGAQVSHPARDPYHHTWDDLVYTARHLPWSVEAPADIAHPRAQQMVRFIRTNSVETATDSATS